MNGVEDDVESCAQGVDDSLAKVAAVLCKLDRAAVAVSGGVDSMTLALICQGVLGSKAEMFHAVSPAVPAEATERVERYASRFNWRLTVVRAGEFNDASYLSNPLNRCYYCKVNLYDTISRHTDALVLSGANVDDLGEYRPGLIAAAEHGVRHPYVEAGIDKRTVRRLAAELTFDDLAELPAAPCLSSRVETGIAIQPEMLELIHSTETMVRNRVHPDVVRCRVREAQIVIELDVLHLKRLSRAQRSTIAAETTARFRTIGRPHPVSFAAYRNGSAFVIKVAR